MTLLPDDQFLIYRDDLNHPTVSGNKLHKLKPQLEYANRNNYGTILSFGGPYSNHLHALAFACREAGLASIGGVRGEVLEKLTPTLQDCQNWGMKLVEVPRKHYRQYQNLLTEEPDAALDINRYFPDLITHLDKPKTTLLIPEGGSNSQAIDSLAKAYTPIFKSDRYSGVSHVVCATGTGATIAGLCLAAPKQVKVVGVQAVAEGDATLKRIQHWLGFSPTQLSIIEGHFGGFAKNPPELKRFMHEFEQQRGIPVDPIYNAKVVYQIAKMYANGHFTEKDKVLIINTGGLQGKRGFS